MPASGVTAAAYTNNDLNQPNTGTTLFDLDTTMDQIVISRLPPMASSSRPASSGLTPARRAGFDIHSQLANGVTVANFPFATLSVNGKYRFFAINLTTGQAISLGSFDQAVLDIAIRLDQ